ncbi:MAG TPA: sigma-70 family RNA polymerase sigma factor [Williamwhitmania sp.]|nr:sigma-70 family RNA polymerase sigma factor [Williamwhitmania sp.]
MEVELENLIISDQELVRQFVDGSHSAFDALLNRHKQKVYSYIMMAVRDQALADDIFQETFIKVVRSLRDGRYFENGKFLSWVIRIAHNLVIDHFRRVKQLGTTNAGSFEWDVFNSPQYSDSNVEQEIIQSQILSDVRNLIDFLPEEQREVVIMRHYMDLSFKEIAEITDVSINTALGRMRYALINLRKLVAEKQIVLTH